MIKIIKQDEIVTAKEMVWDDIKDKYFEILIPNLESAIEWMQKVGVKINKRDGLYWLVFNEDKKGVSQND